MQSERASSANSGEERQPDIRKQGTQSVLTDASKGPFSKYREVMGAGLSLSSFLYFELITLLFGRIPGVLGLGLRSLTYPRLFKSCGKGVIFGRDLIVRHPDRIRIGSRVVLSDGVTLDAKGSEGKGIDVKDGAFIGVGTIITMAGGTITLDEKCNIGSYCRIGTYGDTRIGKKALLAGYCYVVGAHHDTSRTDIPILDQPNLTNGGAIVGDGCWLGARVTVMDGCTIGNDSIVGAHAVVTKDLPPFSISLGIPATVQRMRK